MAAPLRYPLILLAWGAMAAIYLPLLPAAGELVGAARSPAHWRALILVRTRVSSTSSR
ncbi:hypothetical protein, partial [Klebsiella pneumoniae]|uniref:hypothetical protein n=1 Tax=Klebsiella pneumoniae TaxID=573 RepID=UPI00190E981A